jgi:hypothetical protein
MVCDVVMVCDVAAAMPIRAALKAHHHHEGDHGPKDTDAPARRPVLHRELPMS